jgi:hypothetical protein
MMEAGELPASFNFRGFNFTSDPRKAAWMTHGTLVLCEPYTREMFEEAVGRARMHSKLTLKFFPRPDLIFYDGAFDDDEKEVCHLHEANGATYLVIADREMDIYAQAQIVVEAEALLKDYLEAKYG